jgi:hypothetical protein
MFLSLAYRKENRRRRKSIMIQKQILRATALAALSFLFFATMGMAQATPPSKSSTKPAAAQS